MKKRLRVVEVESETGIRDALTKKLCLREKQLKDGFKSMTESLLCLIPVVLNMHKSLELPSGISLDSKYKKVIDAISNEKFQKELSTMTLSFQEDSNVQKQSLEDQMIQKLFLCTSFCTRLNVAFHSDTPRHVDDQVRNIYLFIFFSFFFHFIVLKLFFYPLASHFEEPYSALH